MSTSRVFWTSISLCLQNHGRHRNSNSNSIPKRRSLPVIPSRASSESNQTPPPRSPLSLCVGAHSIPHPTKVSRGGEDAFLVTSCNDGCVIIAVADGVSGWAEKNVDPSVFAKDLLSNASLFVGTGEANYDPQILLQKAHAATSSTGSATVIVAMLERNGILRIASVGDCGLRVMREGHIVFSSSTQEHYFDCPYQLSSEAVGQAYLDAAVSTVQLIEGDTLVTGSDGLFDNIFDREILLATSDCSDVSGAAKALARLASLNSSDSSFDSPYALEARTKVKRVKTDMMFLYGRNFSV